MGRHGQMSYHPDRRKHWEGILQEVVKGNWRQRVIEAAQVSGKVNDASDI